MAFDRTFKQIEKDSSLNKMIYAFFRGYDTRYYQEANADAPYPTNIQISKDFLKAFGLEGDIKPKEIARRYINFNLELERYPFGC